MTVLSPMKILAGDHWQVSPTQQHHHLNRYKAVTGDHAHDSATNATPRKCVCLCNREQTPGVVLPVAKRPPGSCGGVGKQGAHSATSIDEEGQTWPEGGGRGTRG